MKSMDAERQRAVLDHAMQLFAKEELRDITLDQLSKASGVAAFDILRHFQSRRIFCRPCSNASWN